VNVQTRPSVGEAQRLLPFERKALVLQGGGALGAYQAGVYEALAESRIEPDWIAGISIGGINRAIIAGRRLYQPSLALTHRRRHGRASTRPSTSPIWLTFEGVDARVKPGHDESGIGGAIHAFPPPPSELFIVIRRERKAA
jgi:predicted acylesterase/phospholipase RssA